MLELQIKDLCVGYNGKEILHNISLDIENGSFIAIVGPSGAGKSTLLKQINRLDPGKTGGSILWRGKDVDDYDVHELRRNLAYVFQKAVMFNGTTEENIKLSLKYGHEFKPDEIEALYQTVLEEASISQDILDTPAQDLS
ncbi:MAG: ATP-binding cassette domain-containing protein, partial [Parasutterella excrementihominis]